MTEETGKLRNQNNIMAEMYFKIIQDLSQRELLLLYNSLEKKVYPAHFPITDKQNVVLNIIKVEPKFFEDNEKFYFERNDQGIVTYHKDFRGTCDNQKFARHDHKINLNKILTLMKAKSMEEILTTHSDIDETDLSSEEASDAEMEETMRPNVKKEQKPETKSSKSKSGSRIPRPTQKPDYPRQSDYKIKAPKYQESMPIETWLRNMEIFGKCSQVSDERLITVAIANLMSGDAGANVIESLDDHEMKDW